MRLGKRSTEAQWLACTEPGNLLPFLRRKLGPRATDRKLLLFACACWRSVSHLLADHRPRAAVEAVERFLEGRSGLEQVHAALADAEAAAGQAASDGVAYASQAATFAALAAGRRTAYCYDAYDAACDAFNAAANAAAYAAYESANRGPAAWGAAEWDGHRRQCDLLRDILGNPFRPLPLRRFPAHVLELAEVCHAAFPEVSNLFPVLADALDELGEGEAANHARQALHARGCHVVDLILSKDR